MSTRAAAYDYELPRECIAQRPCRPYDSAKLLVVARGSGALSVISFRDLPQYLGGPDLLILNNSLVVRARLFGRTPQGAAVELLLVAEQAEKLWRCQGQPLKKMPAGTWLDLPAGVKAVVEQRLGPKEILVRFASGSKSMDQVLAEIGSMPIPPYIRAGRGDEQDLKDYQTCFGCDPGSIAAPTAGLHFTPELIAAIQAGGCAVAAVTLHVGQASFQALWEEGAEAEVPAALPGQEKYRFNAAILEQIARQRQDGGRVLAVGTTVVRALESMVRSNAAGAEWRGTDLFIEPGFEFRCVDALITNFHLPRSTHLLLVQAFMGRELLDCAYQFALKNDFRFLSYGDAMLIR